MPKYPPKCQGDRSLNNLVVGRNYVLPPPQIFDIYFAKTVHISGILKILKLPLPPWTTILRLIDLFYITRVSGLPDERDPFHPQNHNELSTPMGTTCLGTMQHDTSQITINPRLFGTFQMSNKCRQDSWVSPGPNPFGHGGLDDF